jgi:hypothetical protein
VFLPAVYERCGIMAAVGISAPMTGVGLVVQLHIPGIAFEIADRVADAGGVSAGLTLSLPLRDGIGRLLGEP